MENPSGTASLAFTPRAPKQTLFTSCDRNLYLGLAFNGKKFAGVMCGPGGQSVGFDLAAGGAEVGSPTTLVVTVDDQ